VANISRKVKIDLPPFLEGLIAKNIKEEDRRLADSNEQTKRSKVCLQKAIH
jgi:hypothetical protein